MNSIETLEKINALTRKELYSKDIAEVRRILGMNSDDITDKALSARQRELLGDVTVICEEIKKSVLAGEKPDHLIKSISALPDIPFLFAYWSLAEYAVYEEKESEPAMTVFRYVHSKLVDQVIKKTEIIFPYK